MPRNPTVSREFTKPEEIWSRPPARSPFPSRFFFSARPWHPPRVEDARARSVERTRIGTEAGGRREPRVRRSNRFGQSSSGPQGKGNPRSPAGTVRQESRSARHSPATECGEWGGKASMTLAPRKGDVDVIAFPGVPAKDEAEAENLKGLREFVRAGPRRWTPRLGSLISVL